MSSRVLVALRLRRGGARRDPGHRGNRFFGGGAARAGRPAVRWRLGVIAPRPIGAGLAAALCLVVFAGLAEAAPTEGPAFTAGFSTGSSFPGRPIATQPR